MSREKEGFREQLARLDERFPDCEALSIDEASRYTGVDRRTLVKTPGFPVVKYGDGRSRYGGAYRVAKVALARFLVG